MTTTDSVAGVPEGTPAASNKTDVGSVFVSNYPPFSVWNAETLARAYDVLDTPLRQAVAHGQA